MSGSPMRACTVFAPTCATVCVLFPRARACAWARAYPRRKRGHTLPSACAACGSARRRSARRRRSTRTSAHGTPPRSPRWLRYAPLSAGGAPLRRTRWAGVRCGAAVLSGGTADVRARIYVFAHTCRHSLERVSTCVCAAARREGWNICMFIDNNRLGLYTLCDDRCG